MGVLECFCCLKMCLNIKFFTLNEHGGPLKTSVSRKTICLDDILCVKLIVGDFKDFKIDTLHTLGLHF